MASGQRVELTSCIAWQFEPAAARSRDSAVWHVPRCVPRSAGHSGPGNFALITATGKGGIKADLVATCGVILSDQVLLWMAVAVVTFLYGLAAVLLTHKLAERMRANPRAVDLLERLAGACLLGFGIKLAAMR